MWLSINPFRKKITTANYGANTRHDWGDNREKQEDGEENFLTQEMPEHEKPFPASPS